MNAIGASYGTTSSSDFGVAVLAQTYDGTAVQASVSLPTGWALDAQGPVTFSSAGRTRIPAGQARIVLRGLTLEPTSLVLVSLQTRRQGVFVEAAVPDAASGTATVYLHKATPGPPTWAGSSSADVAGATGGRAVSLALGSILRECSHAGPRRDSSMP